MLVEIPILLMLVGLAAYVVLAGADFGAGFWTLVPGRGQTSAEATRDHARHAMGPVWEANHVWLIFVLVVCWTAYPVSVRRHHGRMKALAACQTDIDITFAGPLIVRLDAGDPITVVAGGHIGCVELFGTDRVRSIRDQKGKTVGVPELGAAENVFFASMAACVGLDPGKHINCVVRLQAEAIRLLADSRVDALAGFPPIPQELRARKIGHVVVNSSVAPPPGRSTSAAWWPGTESSSERTPW